MSDASLPYQDAALPVQTRVDDLLARMTLEEKIAQLSGVWGYDLIEQRAFSEKKAITHISNGVGHISMLAGTTDFGFRHYAETVGAIQRYLINKTRLGIPALVHEECCAGFMARDAICFPQIIGLSSTWDTDRIHAMTTAIGAHMRKVGAHQALAPVLDVTRDPRWGRVEETFGEDPYLTASMGMAYIRGLQGDDPRTGIIATGKHFVGYGLSEGGLNWAPAHIPERELHDVFLFPFEAAVKNAGLRSIMPAYHELDGVPCHSSRELLKDTLRDEWGFAGTIVSDYFGIEMLTEYHRLGNAKADAAKLALDAGVDLEFPAAVCYGPPLVQAVQKGLIDVRLVDDTVRRVLRTKIEAGLFEHVYEESNGIDTITIDATHNDIVRDLAEASIVLLQNKERVLPFSQGIKSIAVIGPNADYLRAHFGDYHYVPHLEITRSMVEGITLDDLLPEADTVLAAIKKRAGESVMIEYAQGCDVTGSSLAGFEAAERAAGGADVAIVVCGDKSGLTTDCTCGEMRDRDDLSLPGVQEALVLAVAKTGTPVVLVLINGRPYTLATIAEHVAAIVEAWLPGEQGGPAIANVLFGDVNPGGKLTISFPRSVGQIPVYYNHKPSGARSQMYGDYVSQSTSPLFPFGHGLSYTRFEYGPLTISPPATITAGRVSISLTIKNAGDRFGDEVVQLYINDVVASVTRPVKELKGFARVSLEPGESRTVSFDVAAQLLAFHDRSMRRVVEPGEFDVMVGASSEDIRRSGSFRLTGEIVEVDAATISFTDVTIS